MESLNLIHGLDDLSLKYLLFFYELTKLGVIRFDLTVPEQKEVFDLMLAEVESYDPDKYKQKPVLVRVSAKNRNDLYKMIVFNIYKNSNH